MYLSVSGIMTTFKKKRGGGVEGEGRDATSCQCCKLRIMAGNAEEQMTAQGETSRCVSGPRRTDYSSTNKRREFGKTASVLLCLSNHENPPLRKQPFEWWMIPGQMWPVTFWSSQTGLQNTSLETERWNLKKKKKKSNPDPMMLSAEDRQEINLHAGKRT